MKLIALALGMACSPQSPPALPEDFPRLAELGDTDSLLAPVNRQVALRSARDADVAAVGPAFDLRNSSDGFHLEVDSATVGAPSNGIAVSRSQRAQAGFGNYLHALGMVIQADVTALAVLGVPAAAIASVSQGAVTQVTSNVWVATQNVVYNGTWVNGALWVAWVEAGWIVQLRLTSSDGALQNTPWLTGFVSKDYRLGWWDMKDSWGQSVGALEWTQDSAGNTQFGILSLQGESSGDVLGYSFIEGTSAVGYYDASTDESSWVEVFLDESGSLRDPVYAGGAEVCWDPYRQDAPCESR